MTHIRNVADWPSRSIELPSMNTAALLLIAARYHSSADAGAAAPPRTKASARTETVRMKASFDAPALCWGKPSGAMTGLAFLPGFLIPGPQPLRPIHLHQQHQSREHDDLERDSDRTGQAVAE